MNTLFRQRLILLSLFVFSFFFTNAQNGRTGPGSAIPINVIPSSGFYDNLPGNGTLNSISGGCCASDSRDRWFRVTLPPNRTITVSTCGGATNFDDEVFIVDDDGSTILADDGGSCGGVFGIINNFTVSGSDPFVYVVVEGQEINIEGDFFLSITSSCPNPPTASNQNFCNTPSFTARVSNLVATGAGGTLNWYNVPTGGTALASTTALSTGTYYVAEQNAGCVGGETPRTSITVGVNPTPTVNAVVNQVLCNNAVTNAVNFTGSVAGTVYSWTNTNTSIGLGASGTGNIAPFNANNAGPLPDTATITVTPSYTANGFTCTGTPMAFSIIVYPSTIANPVTPQVICNGAPTAPITFSSTTIVPASTIVYNWTNNTPSIGLAGSSSGDIPTFAAVNNGTAPVVATITVRPTFTYQGVTCIGSPNTFTITVHPTARVNAIANQTHCRGVSTATINFTTPNTGGTVTYDWANSNTAIGLAASGTGNIPSFTTTNTTTAPIVATITVTPTFSAGMVSCVGTAITFTITVNPTTSVAAVTNKEYCAGTVTPTEVFTGPVTGTVFSWSNDNTAIGLAASGIGDLPSFTTANTTNAPILATITVTSATPDNCAGTSITFTITVYPTATVNTLSNQVVCAGANATAVNFSSPATGGTVTYNWTNANASIGLAASGSGNIVSFAAVNAGTAPVMATITVTPTYTVGATVCTGTPSTFTITVNPTATVDAISNQVLCNGTASTAVNFTSPTTGGTVTYTWTNSNTAIGLPANGTGNLASFTATNIGTAPILATITVTPTFTNGGVSCVGTPRTFTITVNPTATVNPVASQVVCAGANILAINFVSSATGGTVSYDWTNSASSIGLAANGTGNIAAFTAVNNGTAPVVATITVTPTFTNAGVSCVGTPITFTITVNPTATVNPIGNQTLCNGANTTGVNFGGNTTGGSVTYNWTNSDASIGLAASGTGNIPSFAAINTGTSAVTATITVTPVFNNGGINCTGTPTSFTITVNPSAVVNTVTSQVLCTNVVTSPVVFTSPVAGTTYNWTNNNTSIGLNASGTGNLPSFTTASTTNNPQVATITVTPTAPNGCSGTPITFTITVNPVATVNTVSNQVVCNGANTMAVNFSSPATGGVVTYNWTNTNTTIGLGASGTGNILAFAAVNAGTAPVTATITVTPTYTVGLVNCIGTPSTFTITVNPTATVNAINNQVVCNGDATSVVNFASTATGGVVTYNWTNDAPIIGLPANGTGNIASFNAINNGTAPVVATITVTPIFMNGGVSCAGTPGIFTIIVNPTAVINAISNVAVCNNATAAAINFTSTAIGGTVTYDWTNTNTTIGLAASGTGNIASFTAVNNGTGPVVATITVTPTFTNAGVSCTGTPITFTITVNPTATVTPIGNQTLCNGENTTAVNFSGNTTGGSVTYNWTNSDASIGLAASGTGNIPSFAAVNTGTSAVTATITVTPVFNNGGINCTGTPTSFTITVNPSAVVNTVTSQVLCTNVVTSPVVFTSPVAGTTYSWTNNNTSIGLNASGTGSLPSFTTASTTNNPQVATITVTPTAPNGCSGTPIIFTITVNPVATVNTVSNQVVCAGANTTAVNFSSPATGGTVTYAWTNNTLSIGLAASGTGNIAAFAALNAGTAPVTATITVTPTYTVGLVNCVGTPTTFTIIVNPTATVNVINNQVVCNGDATSAVNFVSTATGGVVTYNWTNDAPIIGLPANGTGNIASFNAINNGTAPVVATITVTPIFMNGGVSCAGTPGIFTIIVNPTAVINAISNVAVCNNATAAAINFTSTAIGGTVTYDWTNTNTTIGLAASGTGNIAAFTAINNGTAPVVATITVAPAFTNAGVSCTGTPITFTITVNPTATVNPVGNQTLCNGENTTVVTFGSNTSGGSVTYNWTNTLSSIGLASSGTGNIPSFTAVNTGTSAVTATITVTPVFNNGGINCTGTPTSFTITVNPTATVNAVANQAFCGNTASAAINFSGAVASTTFNWVNDNPAIGLTASGSGNIPSFTTTNDFVNQTMATITVTPVSPAGCVGTPVQFTITIMPVATVNMVANQVLCNGSSTSAIVFGTTAVGGTVTYNWTNSLPGIGIAAIGSGNIPSFTATNTGLGPVTATIVVTPTYAVGATSCVGISRTFTITVNPTVTVNTTPNQVLCNAAATAPITFTTPNTIGAGSNIVYNWSNNNPSIGLAASGTGNIGSFTAINNTTVPQTATVTVTPVYTNMGVTCTGTISTFTITVNPTATVNAVSNQILCNATATTAINFSSPNSGGTIVYNWTNNNPTIGLAATGSGNIASFIATNTSTVPVTANIIVTPVFTNTSVSCTGTPISFNITVQPSGVVNAVPNQVVCANTPTTPVVFGSPISGTTYTWVNNNPAIGLAATGAGNIPSFMAVNTTNTINATVTVTPHTPFGCTGAPITFVYIINPIPTMNQPLNQARCNGAVTDSILFSSPNGTNGGGTIVYNWTNSAPSIGIPASGSGNILPFTAINTGTTPVVAIITVTPSVVNSTTCVGISRTFSITVNPTAVVNAVNSQTLCAGQSTVAVNFTGPVAGTFYTWTNTNTAIGLAASGTGSIPSFVAQNNTLSTITGTVTVTPNTVFGCVGTSRTFDYVVQALSIAPTAIATSITGPTQMVCDTNRTVTLSVVGGGLGTGAVWRWYKDACGGTPIGTGATLSNIDVSQTTTFYVRAEGTCNNTTCASVTVQVAKLITHVRQHWNDVLFFDNSSNNFVKWQWYKNGQLVPGATLQHYSENGVSLNGQYYCVATDRNGNDLITCPLNATTNGFHGIELKAIPNPASMGQQFRVQSSLTPAQLQGATIRITDIIGTVVSQATVTSTITTMQAPTTGGMYIVSLVLRNGQRYSTTLVVR